MKKLIFILLALILVAFAVYLNFGKTLPQRIHGARQTQKMDDWNHYLGEQGLYEVDITDTRVGDHWTRYVIFTAKRGQPRPDKAPFVFMGHDYDGDGQFDRLFILMTPKSKPAIISFYSYNARGREISGPKVDERLVSSCHGRLHLAVSELANKDYWCCIQRGKDTVCNQDRPICSGIPKQYKNPPKFSD